MHIDTIPNRNSRPAYLLRESVRDGKHVRKRTLANLSSLPIEQIEAIRRILKGERLGPIEDGLEVVRSRAHGHVEAVLTAMRRLGFDKLIDAKPSRERDVVVAMVAERIIAPEASKLGMTRAFTDTTLGEDLGVADAHEDELYAAMDWLIERQPAIEKRLARRHLKDGGLVLFDLTSSYFEGVTCPLARIGYSRDGKRGTLQGELRASDRRAGLPGVGLRVRGQHRRSQDAAAAGREGEEELRPRPDGAGRRPRHDLQRTDRSARQARRHRLDHGTEERRHRQAGGRRALAARPVRRAQPDHPQPRGLSRRAADRVP
jgi:hypothetical protein